MDAKSLEIAKEIGWNPDHKSFFKAQMAWNSHREADRSAKQSHAARMEAADLRATPELSKESRKLAEHAARTAGVEGVDVTERLLATSNTRRSFGGAGGAGGGGASAGGGSDYRGGEEGPVADFTPQISSASKAMVERRSELEAVRRHAHPQFPSHTRNGPPRPLCCSRWIAHRAIVHESQAAGLALLCTATYSHSASHR